MLCRIHMTKITLIVHYTILLVNIGMCSGVMDCKFITLDLITQCQKFSQQKLGQSIFIYLNENRRKIFTSCYKWSEKYTEDM